MLGVVIVLAVLDVYDIEKGFAGNIKLNEKESNVLFSPQTFEGTSEVIIYDYVDNKVPMLVKMAEKRMRGYKKIGYEW